MVAFVVTSPLGGGPAVKQTSVAGPRDRWSNLVPGRPIPFRTDFMVHRRLAISLEEAVPARAAFQGRDRDEPTKFETFTYPLAAPHPGCPLMYAVRHHRAQTD